MTSYCRLATSVDLAQKERAATVPWFWGRGALQCYMSYPEPGTLTLLTLGTNRLRDRAGLTEAPDSHSSDQEQVDGIGLQTADSMCLQLHAIGHCPPCVASCLAAVGMR